MGNNRKIAINIIAQLVNFAVGIGVNFLLTPYITAKLGKEVYGYVGLAYDMTSYVSLFVVAFNNMLGIFVATEYYKKNYKLANKYFSSVSIINMVLSLVLILPFSLIVSFMDVFFKQMPAEHVTDIKILWAIIFFVFLMNLATSSIGTSLYVKNRLDIGAKRNLESNVIRAVILVIAFVFFAPKVFYVGLASAVSSVFIVIANFYYWKRLTPELVISRKIFDFHAVKDILKVGIWNTLGQLTNILVNGLDKLVSGSILGSLEMGFIAYAQTFPNQMLSLLTLVCNSFSPHLTEVCVMGDKETIKKEVNSAVRVCGFLCSIPILGFIVFGRSFYGLWITKLTPAEVNTVNILSFLILFHTIFDVYLYPLYTVHSVTKHVRTPLLVSFGVSVLNIIFELVLVKTTNLGVYAIEIATAFLMGARVVFFTPIYTAKILDLKWTTFYKPLGKGVFSSIIILFVYYVIYINVDTSSWGRLIIVAVGAGIIGYAINFLLVLNKGDRALVKNVVARKLKRRKSR